MKVTRATCHINLDDRADRIQITGTSGEMITADQKVLNEDQESRMHRKCAVFVQGLETQWIHSYPCKTKSAQETQRNLRKSYVPKKTQDPSIRTILLTLLKPARSWIGIMRDLHHAGLKEMELQNKLYDECKKALRQYQFSLDSKKAGGQKQWSVIAISDMCKTCWQLARRLVNVGTIHHSKGRSFR